MNCSREFHGRHDSRSLCTGGHFVLVWDPAQSETSTPPFKPHSMLCALPLTGSLCLIDQLVEDHSLVLVSDETEEGGTAQDMGDAENGGLGYGAVRVPVRTGQMAMQCIANTGPGSC